MNDQDLSMHDITRDLMHGYLDNQIREMTRKHLLTIKELDESQLVEVIKQQIASGDIMKHIHIGHGESGSTHQQSITYIPFAGVERLKEENRKLKEMLNHARMALAEEK